MKTNNYLRKWLATLFLMLAAVSANAYDAYVDGIYYNLNSDTKQAEVTSGDDSYKGDVVIPSSVTCDGVPYDVTSIGQKAFYFCSNLTSISIPMSVTSIGDYAFGYCQELTSMNLPSGLMTIGNHAFALCSNINSIIIPSSVTNIGEWAFELCVSLTSIIVDTGNSVYDSRENCNAIIESSSNTLMVGCQKTVIPSSVTCIGDGAFRSCSFSSIDIPSSVTTIGNSAFASCHNLTNIAIPTSVTKIGDYAFTYCRNLTSIVIPSSVMTIGKGAFQDTGLISIFIPSSVMTIGTGAFGSTGLTSIIVAPENPIYDSREDCNAIIETSSNTLVVGCQNTVIPLSVTSIGDYAFAYHSGLTSIDIPSSVTSIGEYGFYECSGLTSIDIPSSVTRIENYTFCGCTGLTSVIIPSSVTSIGDYAFSRCSSLASIIIPTNVTSIGDYAFSGCSSLASIIIPTNVTSIGWYVLASCSNITSVVCYAVVPPDIEYGTWWNMGDEPAPTLYVPASSIEAYEELSEWADNFSQILPIGEEVETGIKVSIGAAGYATLFCAGSDLEIPKGVKAYTGTVNDEWLTLNEVKGKIPAGTAVVLKGEQGMYELQKTTDADAVSENDLKGTTEPLVADGTQYILYEKGGVTAFYQATPGSTIPAGKAYIETDGAGVKGFFFADDATAIEETLSNSPLKGENIYNLAGQRLNRMQDGINIVNGKKVLVK